MFTRTLCPDLHRQWQDRGFWHQEVCNNQWLCLLFWYERSLNSYLDTLVLWDISPPYSLSAGFSSKLAIPCPNDSSLNLLACHDVSRTSLDSVTEELTILLFCEDFHFHSFSHSSCIWVLLRARACRTHPWRPGSDLTGSTMPFLIPCSARTVSCLTQDPSSL